MKKIASGPHSEHYYVELAKEDYYSKGGASPGYWLGSGAQALALKDLLCSGDQRLGALMRGYHPHHLEEALRQGATTIRTDNKGRKIVPTAAYDFTLSAPKSVSTLYALSGAEVQGKLDEAQAAAVKTVATHLEMHLCRTRTGRGGKQVEKIQPIFAAFDHLTSRELDPQLHTHLLLMNTGIRRDGKGGAIHGKPLLRKEVILSLGQLYRDTLANELKQRLPLTLKEREISGGTSFEIQGIPSALCEHLSKRSAQIQAVVSPDDSPRQRKQKVLQTRAKKVRHLSRQELFQHWRREAVALGYNPEHIVAQALEKEALSQLPHPEKQEDENVLPKPESAPEHSTVEPEAATSEEKPSASSSPSVEIEQEDDSSQISTKKEEHLVKEPNSEGKLKENSTAQKHITSEKEATPSIEAQPPHPGIRTGEGSYRRTSDFPSSSYGNSSFAVTDGSYSSGQHYSADGDKHHVVPSLNGSSQAVAKTIEKEAPSQPPHLEKQEDENVLPKPESASEHSTVELEAATSEAKPSADSSQISTQKEGHPANKPNSEGKPKENSTARHITSEEEATLPVEAQPPHPGIRTGEGSYRRTSDFPSSSYGNSSSAVIDGSYSSGQHYSANGGKQDVGPFPNASSSFVKQASPGMPRAAPVGRSNKRSSHSSTTIPTGYWSSPIYDEKYWREIAKARKLEAKARVKRKRKELFLFLTGRISYREYRHARNPEKHPKSKFQIQAAYIFHRISKKQRDVLLYINGHGAYHEPVPKTLLGTHFSYLIGQISKSHYIRVRAEKDAWRRYRKRQKQHKDLHDTVRSQAPSAPSSQNMSPRKQRKKQQERER